MKCKLKRHYQEFDKPVPEFRSVQETLESNFDLEEAWEPDPDEIVERIVEEIEKNLKKGGDKNV